MRVFVTGASGHIGLPVVEELLGAGHEVVGLARSEDSAARIEAAGAAVRRGDLDDLDGLAAAAGEADGVIHLAFKHDLMATGEMEAAIAADLAATQAFGDTLAGTDNAFVNTSGTLMLAMAGVSGRAGTEDDRSPGGHRGDAENATLALADRGVRSAVIRLSPFVHSDLDKHGFGPTLIGIARDEGFAGYSGDGTNRRPPSTPWMPRASTASRSSRRRPDRCCTGRRRSVPIRRSPRRSGGAPGSRCARSPRTRPGTTSGSSPSPSSPTTRPRAPRPASPRPGAHQPRPDRGLRRRPLLRLTATLMGRNLPMCLVFGPSTCLRHSRRRSARGTCWSTLR